MAEIVKELTLEVYSANRIKAIIAKQYDYKSRFLLIRLTDSGEDISVEPSSVVTVNAFRPNGESAAFLGSAEQDGRILVPLTYWMLELEGTVKCDVSVVDTDERKLSSTNFQIEVERANYSGDDIEQDEHYDLLVELLAEVAQAQEAENARVAAETARVTAENGRVSAETARQTAETARATAETARATAETARDTAEGARSSAETARGTAETARASAETTRQANEASRVSAEAARVAAETAREEAEEEREHALDDYAKKDGYYEGLTAGLSDNLTPYSEDSGTTQTQPFFLEGTATGNGESRVDAKQVPAFAFLQEKRGNMVCVNQKVQNSDFSGGVTGWRPSNGTLAITGGIATLTCSADGNATIDRISYGLVTGHKNIVVATMKAASGKTLYISGVSANKEVTANGSWQVLSYIEEGSITAGYPRFGLKNAVVGDEVQYSVITISDLTQWFNGNIPAYLLSHPEAFGRYYKGSLAYEPGRLEPATGRYLTSVGRNIWDEEWEVTNNYITSKNYTVCSPNSVLYFRSTISAGNGWRWYDENRTLIKTDFFEKNVIITVPSNAFYFKFSLLSSYGTTYKHDTTISLYYPGESGYDKYYPHEVLATIDTGTESLYSAGSAYDSKIPSGLITRRIGSVDLGTLDWIQFGYGDNTFYNVINGMKKSFNVLTSKYIINLSVESASLLNNGDCWVSINGTGAFFIKDSTYTDAASFKAAMSGVILYYELAEPTTEQGTPFQENIPIDDFGQLSWSNTDVPQGNQIFYPVDYKAAVDTLIKYTDGDATSIALKGELASGDPQTLKALIDYVNGKIPAAPTTDGAYDLVCTVTNGTPTYSWVART